MKVSYLAVSRHRCTVQLAGCNFRCRGCFSDQKLDWGKEVAPQQLVSLIPAVLEVMLAGGEPVLDREGLVSLINELDGYKVILSTNGYLLDGELLELLRGVIVHIDLKALDPALHRWYTGEDNGRVLEAIRLLYERDFDFEVNTVYIPGVVETSEIRCIARFLAGVGDIRYKITQYVPVDGFSRRPARGEVLEAVEAAREHLVHVTSSMEHRSHPADRRVVQIS